MDYDALYQRSIDHPDAYWAEQAARIHWQKPFEQVLDYSHPPFARWFVGGKTNLCYNAVDRWAATQPDTLALIAVSSETGLEETWTFSALLDEVQCCAAILQSLGVGKGDRVLIYLPMIAQAMFAMMACARIGAVHSVVFGGFAATSLATRIDDARPTLIISADAGSRAGKVVPYKPLLDTAIALAQHKPASVLLVDRGLAPMQKVADRDFDYATLRLQHRAAQVPVEWLDATDLSYILYTSGTTGTPKGVQRDVGGYAVALAASMHQIFGGKPGGVFFTTSDIGWVVGHSYIIYGPLIAGMATVLYEGLPTRPDAGVWWRIVQQYRVTRMFSAPTAIRVLKKQSTDFIDKFDLGSLEALYLAGEPLDETTSRWIADALGVPVVDNYWQTESGWPILSIARAVDDRASRLGSPGVAMPGYRLRVANEVSGATCAANQKGVVVIDGPLPPGCLQTVWDDDARFVRTYWSVAGGQHVYSTFDWGIRDTDGYHFILGRTDDVINVAGHRLGTREIEECIARHAGVSEVAVVGVNDALKGQVAVAFITLRDGHDGTTTVARQGLAAEVMAVVDRHLGAVARPAQVHVVTLLPKTRSGKLVRRALQALCEGRDPGDLTTLEDPQALEQVRLVLALD